MPFSTFDVLSDEGWLAFPVDPSSPRYFWEDGSPFADAPVDMVKTFQGNMWLSSEVDQSFKLNGLRCAPNFSIPRRHHNIDEMIIVLGGEFHVAWDDETGAGSRTVGRGEFWIATAGTSFLLTAGSEGVTYLETWPAPVSELKTYWHDEGWTSRRQPDSSANVG